VKAWLVNKREAVGTRKIHVGEWWEYSALGYIYFGILHFGIRKILVLFSGSCDMLWSLIPKFLKSPWMCLHMHIAHSGILFVFIEATIVALLFSFHFFIWICLENVYLCNILSSVQYFQYNVIRQSLSAPYQYQKCPWHFYLKWRVDLKAINKSIFVCIS